jgi:hypothetical protein
MNTIERIESQFESSNKAYKGKIMSGARERATKQYFKDTAARARRKQGKQNYDTFRRDEQPDAEDQRLEDIYFANFLGLPRSEYGVPYNNEHVNLSKCDIYLEPSKEKDEKNQAFYLNFDYDSAYRKRTRNEEDDLPPAKRICNEELNEYKQEQDNFEAMVAYMRAQVKLAEQIMMENDMFYF